MVAKLYYGNGHCTIEGHNIRAVQILYRGAITITDKTSDSFAITYQENGILIFPIGKGSLNELFDYEGELKIIRVIAVDDNADEMNAYFYRVMDYTELLNTNAEDMTVNSEDLSAGYIEGNKVEKTSLRQHIIPNLNTSGYMGALYLENGIEYMGYYHIHLPEGAIMTGGEHTETSQDLYFKQKDSDVLMATKGYKINGN